MDKLKILIADDTIVYRKILTEAVESTGLASVERTASNGLLLLEWMKQLSHVDVVLLDVFMPELDGIETLKVIKKDFPSTDVIMISGGGTDNAQVTVEALELGAVDFILKPTGDSTEKNMEKIKTQLHSILAQITIKKMAASARASNQTTSSKAAPIPPLTKLETPVIKNDCRKGLWHGADLILIASSTGGPSALDVVVGGLSQNIGKPVLIVQHMPPDFTKVLAQSLDKKSSLAVSEGRQGDVLSNNHVILAPGGFHMVLTNKDNAKSINLLDTPHVNGVRPAADVLFKSVADHFEGKNILVVILTGMGNDGLQGIVDLRKKCNCYCITQSEATCVVYGMPRCAYEAGVSNEVTDLDNIASRIAQVASGRC